MVAAEQTGLTIRSRSSAVNHSHSSNVSSEFKILLPEIGAGPHPIRVVQWLVDSGSEVMAGDRILEVAATGVVFSVSAPCNGVLTAQWARTDAIVTPGDRLGVIETDQLDEF